MKTRGPFFGAVAAAAAAAALLTPALTARQPAALRDRSATEELFRGRRAAAGEVLVAFRQPADVSRLRADIDAESDAPLGAGRIWHARSRSRTVASLIAQLSARPDVLYAEPNYILYAAAIPNDPRFGELWGLLNTGQTIAGVAGTPGADVHAWQAWDTAIGARTNVVGVVDTGIDYNHPDLAANIWSAPSAFSVVVGGQTVSCAAGTHGFNAINRTCDPLDDHGHGTHVSGTIGAVGSNAAGVAGVNWLANIMGLKFLSAAGSGTTSDAINAIEFAIQVKAAFPAGGANVRVLSNSWSGGGFSQALSDEIARANASDMLFVAAAGNSGTSNDTAPAYPASYAVPNVIAVAATNNQDGLASFSNYGASSVHLGAPGVQVLSTLPNATYGYFSGTSMATPHVSGAAALLLSRCALNTASLKSLLLNSVEPIPSLAGVTMTGGRLDLNRAMSACGPAGNLPPTVTLTDPPADASFATPLSLTLRASAADSDGIASVAFFDGTALIGSATSAPYQFSWNKVVVGTHAITAVATDTLGAATTTAPVVVTVIPGSDSVPFGGTAATVPGVIEAENFNDGGEGVSYHDLTPGNTGGKYRQTDVDIETTFDTGGGFDVGWMQAGEWLAYSMSAAVTASYTFQARVASGVAGGTFHVEVDGHDMTGPIAVPNTGGWQAFQTISFTGIPLLAGSHMLRVIVDTNGTTGFLGNLNWMRWTAPGVNSPPSVTLTAPANGTSYVGPAMIALAATASDFDGTVAQVSFYAGTTLIGTDTAAPYTFTWNNVRQGMYAVTAIATDNAGATATSNVVTVQVTGPPAAVIPGVIEAENFDDGGEGVGYHDSTPGNSGGKYRQTDVDVESTSDSTGAFDVGWITAGEWLKFTTTVAATDTYSVEMRVASPQAGGTLHIEVDGADATGPLAVPNTGGWQSWGSVVKRGIPLAAGTHVLRVVVDTNGGTGFFGNLNYFRWTQTGTSPPAPTPFGGTPAAIPGIVEAENFDDGGEGVAYHDLTAGNSGGKFRATDVDIESTTDVGGGYDVGWISAGEWLNYTVSVSTTAMYTVEMRVAWPQAGGSLHVEVDGLDATGPLSVPATGGYQTWTSVTKAGVQLTAGTHALRVVIDTNGATGYFGNLNYFRWSLPASGPTPFGGTPSVVPGQIEIENFDDGGEGVAYHDLTAGNAGGKFRATDVDIESTSDAGGGYDVGWINAGEWLKYTVSVATTATYTLEMRVAWPQPGGTFHVEVDGAAVTGAIAVPATGGYQTWSSVFTPGIALGAGPHVLRIVFDTNGSTGYVGNLNYMRWTISGT